ncbi:hypothetical protein OG474_09825 [Kribbella sp. NBC_01505]|uniref:hypothetical protein n=1 Tax=Kribbella sp. NBC_01505 TaxID=2903580 RepID=UPI00386FDEA9
MSFFGRRERQVTYTCPGCGKWQLDVSTATFNTDQAAISAALTEHRKECPELSAIYARAAARQADQEVPVAPALPASTSLEAIEAEITELALKASRNGRAAREYVSWHERINELLDWRDEVKAAEPRETP